MSKYDTYNCQNITSQEILLAALAELGWKDGAVEVHQTPQTLMDWHGQSRPQKANIIIRRRNTGLGASNDVGFIKNADGTFSPIVSDYDSSLTARGERNSRGARTFVESIQNAYGEVAGNKALATILNDSIPAMKLQGLLPEWATVATSRSGSTESIEVTY